MFFCSIIYWFVDDSFATCCLQVFFSSNWNFVIDHTKFLSSPILCTWTLLSNVESISLSTLLIFNTLLLVSSDAAGSKPNIAPFYWCNPSGNSFKDILTRLMISCSYWSETSLRFASNKPLGRDRENVEELTNLNTCLFVWSKSFGDTVCSSSYSFGYASSSVL